MNTSRNSAARKRDRKRRAEPLVRRFMAQNSLCRSQWLHEQRAAKSLGAARTAEFVEPDQSDSTSPVPFAKIFLFSRTPNHIYHSCHPGPREGRIMIVT